MMKNIFYILIAALSLLLHAKCVGQNNIVYGAGILYTNGVPTLVPQGNASKVAIDTGTMKWYEYAQVGGWRWSGDRVQDISGCSAPAYTPGKAQSRLVLNSCTEAQNGHGPEMYKHTGSAWLCLNCGGNYTAGTGIDITGTEITNTAPDQVVSITGAGVNAVTGTYPNFTVTGTEVDGSVTNELQTLLISNDTLSISDGNSVVLPGGGMTWPLLAPSSATPNYSFSDYPNTGIFSNNGSISIVTDNGDEAPNDLIFTLGITTDETGGGVQINCGNSENSTGGSVSIIAGGSTTGGGGGYSMYAGYGATSGGNFVLRSGASAETGGNMTLETGSGTNANGGNIQLLTGVSDTLSGKIGFTTGDGGASSGSVEIKTGGATSTTSGLIQIRTGNVLGETAETGNIEIKTGDTEGFTETGNIEIKTGYGLNSGSILIESGLGKKGGRNNVTITAFGVVFTPITEAQRNAIASPMVGMKIFCSDCGANDTTIGVEQTYTGVAWKSHW